MLIPSDCVLLEGEQAQVEKIVNPSEREHRTHIYLSRIDYYHMCVGGIVEIFVSFLMYGIDNKVKSLIATIELVGVIIFLLFLLDGQHVPDKINMQSFRVVILLTGLT